MSQDKRSALPEDAEVTDSASREQARKLQQALNLVASVGEDGDIRALDGVVNLVPAALQKIVGQLQKQRQWDFLWFVLEVEMMRQRIAELDHMIEAWQEENEILAGEIDVLKESISRSRQVVKELRLAEEQRDFDRDPQTGQFRNKAVDQAVSDYERRFGPVDRNNPDTLVLVLQWARQQQLQAQADWQLQVDDRRNRIDQNSRKIDKAKQERDTLQQQLGEEKNYSQQFQAKQIEISHLEKESEKLAVRIDQGMDASHAELLNDFDSYDDPHSEPSDGGFDFLGGVDSSGETKFGFLTEANSGASLDLDAGGIKCSVDMRSAFVQAVHDTQPDALVHNDVTRSQPENNPPPPLKLG